MRQSACLNGLVFLVAIWCAPTVRADSTDKLTFERHIRPILKAHCFHCHGEAGEVNGGLDVRLRRLLATGGDSGPAIVPARHEESLLFERVQLGEMPPEGKKLSADEIRLIGLWIDEGAVTSHPEPDDPDAVFISEDERAFWSFQPIKRPALPSVQAVERVRTPIDAFVLARLEAEGLSYAPEASATALIRRLSLDLTGLPPSAEIIDSLATGEPGAYEQLVERLLSSPRYGERWGRHWLDVAGYADSEGYDNADPVRDYAYKYRDYVIDAFNADKPFDQFITEQLAGDELVQPPYANLSAEDIKKLVATGFLRMATDGTGSSGVDRKRAANQVIADTIKIVSTSLLGLSVGCAECHDHRYDPIPQSDYYRFRAVFEPAYNSQSWRVPKARRLSLYTDADRAKASEVEAEAKKIDEERLRKQAEYIEQTFQKELAKLPEELREAVASARNTPEKERTAEQQRLLKEYPSVNVSAGSLYLYDRKAADDLKKYSQRATEVRAKKPVEDFIRALSEVPGQVPKTHLFFRGDIEQPREEVEPAELTVLASFESTSTAPLPIDSPDLSTTGRRLAYARHLTSGEHPLVARVIVNRVWMHHFGRGLVATPGDFGRLGDRPTHPKLLDWLASEFVSSGWSLKHLQRLIVTSGVYRQSTRASSDVRDADPDNLLLSRMPVRRLEAEVIRDAMLSVSGKLNGKMFGSAVPVMADRVGQFVIGIENLNAGRPGDIIPMHGEENRRSVYIQVRRSRPLSVLDTFDAPAMDPNCEIRAASTVAPQALLLMNSQFAINQAEHFARRVRDEAGDEPAAQAARAWRLAFGRNPSAAETQEAVAFLADQTRLFQEQSLASEKPSEKPKDGNTTDAADASGRLALSSFCQMLLSSNEFLYTN